MRKIDWKTRKVKTVYKMHHPKAEIDRLYIYIKGRRMKRPVTN
jgi:hypothetical protein